MKKPVFIIAIILSFGFSFWVLISSKPQIHEAQKLDREEHRGAWGMFETWYNQRALPNELIPQGAFERAARYVKTSMSKNNKSQLTSEAASEWKSLGPTNIGGRTLDIAIHPTNTNIVWAGAASGGLWKSTTGGVGSNAWSYVNTGYQTISVSAVEIDPVNPDVMYIGTGEISRYQRPLVGTPGARASYGMGILKSTNGGVSWAQLGLTWTFPQITAVQRIIINPLNTRTLFAATSEGVFKSLDAGQSWSQVNVELMAMDIVMNPVDTNLIYSAHGNLNSTTNPGLYMSVDAGDSWFKVTNGLPADNFGRTALTISPSDPSILYAGIASGSLPSSILGLYKTSTGGSSWTQVSTSNYVGSQGWYDNVIAVHPENPDTIFCAGLNIHKSTSGGPSLDAISSGFVHVDHHAIAFDPSNPSIVYFGTDGGIYKSTNSGDTFIDCNDGYVTTQFYPGFANAFDDSSVAMGGLQDNGSAKYSGGALWTQVLGADGGWCAIDPTNKNIMYGEYQNMVLFKSTNGGSGFSNINNNLPSNETNTNFIPPFVLSPSSPNVLYAGLKIVYKTTNGGDNWFPTNNGVNFNGTNVACIGVSWTSPETLLAATGTGSLGVTPLFQIFRSINGGTTWSNVTGSLPNRYPTDIEFDPKNSTITYLTYSGYGTPHVFKSTNAGLTWSDLTANLPDIPHQAITVDYEQTQNLYVGTDLGVFRSSDGGSSWEEYNEGMPTAMVLDVTISRANKSIRASTFGNGVYERKLVRTQMLSLSVPNGGETWVAGHAEAIQWSQQFINLVKIEYSTDNGTTWILINDNTPASNGFYDWTLPNIATTQARVRISDAESGVLVDSSDSAFTIIFNPDVTGGWNIVSLEHRVPDVRSSIVFPTSISDAFTFVNGYVKRDSLVSGVGYWLKFDIPQFIDITGDTIEIDTFEVKAGWNMIGSITKPVAASNIIEIPSGNTASLYYGFRFGYLPADTIIPKRGYWVKANTDGKLILSQSASLKTETSDRRERLNGSNSLTITDRVGNTQTLYLKQGMNQSDLKRYELPPLPPVELFDVRFESQRMVESLPGKIDHTVELPISIKGAEFPIKVSWSVVDLDEGMMTLDTRIGKHDLTRKGEITIDKPITGKIFLHVQPAMDEHVPGSFTLYQNYPNPFNPLTVIRYSLSVANRVELKVYNILGQEVATLVNEIQDAGDKSVEWDGSGLPSGIYFYRLQVGHFSESKKLILLK